MTTPTQNREVAEAAIPELAACPYCGGEPLDPDHNLSALGYHHDDQRFHCSACQRAWTHGVPVGEPEPDIYADLECDVCDAFGLVHRVVLKGDETVGLHVKCPECYYFWTVQRLVGEGGAALVGYPQITGTVDPTRPYATVDGRVRPDQ